MPAKADDWRRMGQERFLAGAVLERRAYSPPSDSWDHDHCAFCWAKFMGSTDDDGSSLAFGYVTIGSDAEDWICDRCFADFGDEFAWTVRSHQG